MGLVPGFGPPGAKIAFIGDAPGETEEQQGRPFVGSGGRLLHSILAMVGINRHECYFTNVVKTRPPQNDFGVLYVDKAQTTPSPMLSQSTADLHAELNRVRPNVIVPLGGEALRALTNKRGIDVWRGSILSSPFGKLVPTYHPTRILREYTRLPIFEHDLRRVAEQSKFPELRQPQYELELNPSYSRVMEFLQSLLDSPRPIAFDIETTKNHVRCLGLADSPTHALCIPFMSFRRAPACATSIFLGPVGSPEVNSHWSEEEELSILTLLDRVFLLPTVAKYAQNAPFDTQILGREFGIRVRGLRLDTMGAAHTMYCELPKGLDFLASLYTEIPYYSDYDPSVDEELWTYNCLDCCATWQIAGTLLDDLRHRPISAPVGVCGISSLDFYDNHIHPALQVMTRVSQRGVLCDTKVRDELKTQYQGEMSVLLAKFHKLAGSDVNPASTKQMQELLYGRLHLPVQTKRSTGAVTTDEHAIETLVKKAPQHKELFDTLLDWKERQKLVSTYLDIPLSPDGRLMTSFNAFGTVTGRCNSSANIWGEGTNLQNIPVKTDLGKPLRRMFIADPGYTLVKCDLSQAEFRLVVWFAGIRRLIDAYLTDPNYDCHKWVASLIFKCPIDAVTKSQRSIAKNGVYGGNYKMQPVRAAAVYKLSLEDATFVLGEYRKAIPEIPAWWGSIERSLNSTRTLVNPLGRVRVFMDRMEDNTYRDAYSHACQSTVADIIHRSAVVGELILNECSPVLQIHDELVWSCRSSALGRNLPIIRNIMQYPLTIPGVAEPLVIPAELSYGPNWLDQTKWSGK